MTTAILVVMGIVLAAVAALMSIYYGGTVFDDAKTKAEAGRLVSEGAMMEHAFTLFINQERRMPGNGSSNAAAISELISKGYLTNLPIGMESQQGAEGRWQIDYQDRIIYSQVGAVGDAQAMSVCQTARQQLQLPNPSTVYKCNGSDYPGGKLPHNEPCCIKG